jgi:hypothetical protein
MTSPVRITIFLVVYEKPREFEECLRRIYATTDIPFRLIVVVNDQTAESAVIVRRLQQEHDNVEAIFNRENQWCGGGSNQALARVESDYAVYVCSRECFIFDAGCPSAGGYCRLAVLQPRVRDGTRLQDGDSCVGSIPAPGLRRDASG